MHGGEIIAKVLAAQGVKFLFTLSGGHIAPIFVAAKQAGIRVIDVRHEVNAVFAADAVARISGIPGVAAVTAGPGLTNTITAVKNAQLAQSPLIILGGATATILKGRGALQDIDQRSLMQPHVKASFIIKRLKDFAPSLIEAFKICQQGVPGSVFVECPVDLLYDEKIVRQWYQKDDQRPARNLQERLVRWYIARHLDKIFADNDKIAVPSPYIKTDALTISASDVETVANKIKHAQRPLFVIGSQATLNTDQVGEIAGALNEIGVPLYLSGMARGLLGKDHPLQLRHKRREAIREADLILLAGVPCDFRLDYGRHLRHSTFFISVNRSKHDLYLNKRPNIAMLGDAGQLIIQLAKRCNNKNGFNNWIATLKDRDQEREREIDKQATDDLGAINPLALFRQLDQHLKDEALLVADGGDFVATASYTLNPRRPLAWLDPGAFGTLGVGGGFALGAKLARPHSEVWIIWGDGSSAYSLAEFDTFVRHQIPIIGLIGNDACWSQIARDQMEILKDDTAAMLAYSDYHTVAEGFGGAGIKLTHLDQLTTTIAAARDINNAGRPYLINAIIGRSEFRKGSLSM